MTEMQENVMSVRSLISKQGSLLETENHSSNSGYEKLFEGA